MKSRKCLLGRINSTVRCHAFSSLLSSFSSIFFLPPFPPLMSSPFLSFLLPLSSSLVFIPEKYEAGQKVKWRVEEYNYQQAPQDKSQQKSCTKPPLF